MATNPSHEQLFVALKRLRTGWPSRGWSWDSRMTCITSTFTTEFETKARSAIAEVLTSEWTPSAVSKAPAHLREYVDRYGGLRSGQILFSSGTIGGSLVAFGLWWPWGDQNTVSMRVGFTDIDPGRDAYHRLREIFGVQL